MALVPFRQGHRGGAADTVCDVKRLMRAVLAAGCCCCVAAACGPAPPVSRVSSSAPPVVAAPAPVVPTVPGDPVPASDGDCPYLDTAFVEETNGQRVAKVQVSADAPHPACFFYRNNDVVQLRVQVLTGIDPAIAKQVVDRIAPVDTSDPASLPGGWEGGKQPTADGAVFAVHRADAAILVTTNQEQTIKASQIAERVLATLGL